MMSEELTYEEPLQKTWLDELGHLNEGYYMVPFANAAWHFSDRLGCGVEYVKGSGCGFYTVETHLRYLMEVRFPATLRMSLLIFGVDNKKMHVGQVMSVDGVERATLESMTLHVDSESEKTVPIPNDLRERLEGYVCAETPSWVGRSISSISR